MKLVAVNEIQDILTVGRVYEGNILIAMVDRGENSNPRFYEEIVAVVFSDSGYWVKLNAVNFKPM